MEILSQLGLNQTVWIQLIFFLICYVFLSRYLFKPFLRNLEHREKNTGGSIEEAQKITVSADRLAMDYQGHMKKQNEAATEVYDKLRLEGTKEEERLLAEAKAKSNQMMDQAKKKVTSEIAIARDALKAEIPNLSSQIASRILGRELR